jgi:asparagine N-glycosylation enzyme membrane subunit Stt3
MKIVLHIAICIIALLAGVLFRPFWLSEWGAPIFILLVWISLSLSMGWGGKGRPYSLSFGIACGSIVAFCLVATIFTSMYVSLGLSFLLAYLGTKTEFYARRMAQLKAKPKVKD